ncbi:MAG: anhydro-N-acetylmuramic acid kinase, partial [Rhodothermales bacterium]
MRRLRSLWEAPSLVVVGLMSGTSLDGIDAAIARIAGTGEALRIELLGFDTTPYPEDLRTRLLSNSTPASSNVLDISQLNVRLAHEYRRAVDRVVEAAGLTTGNVDLVGSHGQTLHHVPNPIPCAGRKTASTLQVGDPSVLANLLDIPVVGGFRLADMALGGQGAPL